MTMDTQADPTRAPSPSSGPERRVHPRVDSDTHCVVKTRAGMYEYRVRNLSVSGALLTGGPPLHERCPMVVILRVPLYPEVRILARVVRTGSDEDGTESVGIEFVHRSDITEDHIQAALLSELERSRTNGRIADVLRA